MTDQSLASASLMEILSVTIRLGLLMLRNGASSNRVDEAMRRAGVMMGAQRIEPYLTPTGIIASAFGAHESHTEIARIRLVAVNLQRVYDVELLIRTMKPGTDARAINAQLDHIERSAPPYAPLLMILGAATGCASFAIVRGGGPPEFAAAFVGAFIAQSLRFRLTYAHLQVLPTTVICALAASSVAIGLVRVFAAPKPEIGVVAAVLLLVPGVPLITSLVDLLLGNLVSGVIRAVYVLLVLTSIGVGLAVAVSIWNFTIV